MSTYPSFANPTARRVARRAMSLMAPAALLLMMVGCKQTPEQIGTTVQGSMQKTFDTDPNFSPLHFKVDKVVAVKKTDTDYDGTASINYQGKDHDVPVHIVLNNDKVNWKTDPGSLSFAE